VCVCVCAYISIMDLPLWARKCRERLVRYSCNYFDVTVDKRPSILHEVVGLSLCVFVYVK
jgi:hypothetical protein